MKNHAAEEKIKNKSIIFSSQFSLGTSTEQIKKKDVEINFTTFVFNKFSLGINLYSC